MITELIIIGGAYLVYKWIKSKFSGGPVSTAAQGLMGGLLSAVPTPSALVDGIQHAISIIPPPSQVLSNIGQAISTLPKPAEIVSGIVTAGQNVVASIPPLPALPPLPVYTPPPLPTIPQIVTSIQNIPAAVQSIIPAPVTQAISTVTAPLANLGSQALSGLTSLFAKK